MTDSSISNSIYFTTIGYATVSAAVSWWLWNYMRGSRPRRRDRSWSFSSRLMIRGVFPPAMQYPDPTIHGTMFFADCPSPEEIVAHVIPKLFAYDRLRTAPHFGKKAGPPKSVNFMDLVRHVVVNGSDQATIDAIQDNLHVPLSSGRGDLPWWEFVLIENQGEGQSACVWRVHHALGDGLSLIKVFGDIATYKDGTPLSDIIPKNLERKFEQPTSWWEAAGSVLSAIVTVGKLPMTRKDDSTVFSKWNQTYKVYNEERSLVVFDAMPMEFVKALKNKAGVTVNDIAFACVSQAIHDYLIEQKCPVFQQRQDKTQCRALLPIAFMRKEFMDVDPDHKSAVLSNKWSFVSADMAVGVSDVLERLNMVHRNLTQIKHSPQAVVQLTFQNVCMPYLPYAFNQKLTRDVFLRHSMVFSNVPGPTKPCMFAGKEVMGVQMFFGNLIPQIGLLSYREQLFGNLCVDPVHVPDAQSIAPLYSRAFVQLAEKLDVPIPESLTKYKR